MAIPHVPDVTHQVDFKLPVLRGGQFFLSQLIANKPTADLLELCELVSSLKKIEESGKPIEKGQLSKFSDIPKKHSDILIALGGWAVKLLTGN